MCDNFAHAMLDKLHPESFLTLLFFQEMDTRGQISKERALDQHGIVLANGPEYVRSSSLSSIRLATTASNDHVVMYSIEKLNSGILTFKPQDTDEKKVITLCQAYGPLFKAHTLMKVNHKPDGDCDFVVGEEFYPALYRMLKDKRDWGDSLNCEGRATSDKHTSEWTGQILNQFGYQLQKAGIFGAVGVSRYSYDHCRNIWRAFCELWGPLSNTLHHAAGEMSISLYDLKIIGGLPILGKPYEEFIPQNQELIPGGHYPSTLAELLRIHSELCIFHKGNFVYQYQWRSHFHRIPHKSSRQLPLNISKEGSLAAFLAFWLSRFVLPSRRSQMRPETFYMACLMARGVKISLAPTVLGYIYHGLGQIATEPRGPGKSGACLPIHYIIGWLGEYFPNLYTRFSDNKFPDCYPRLARYAGVTGKSMNMHSARIIFKTHGGVNYRPISFDAREGESFMDDGRLSTGHLEMLISTRSALLPVRVGHYLWLEPYYPNRFARQFGFDQGVPSNKLRFHFPLREQCSLEDMAKAQSLLQRDNTMTRFYIPSSIHIGQCTWWYCRWWMKSCAPYLRLSLGNIFEVLKSDRTPTVDKKHDLDVLKRKAVSTCFEEDKIYEARARPTPRHNEGTHTTTEKRMRTHKRDCQPPSPCSSQNMNPKQSQGEGYNTYADTTTSRDSVSSESLGDSPEGINFEQIYDMETTELSSQETIMGEEVLPDETPNSPHTIDELAIVVTNPLLENLATDTMQEDPLPDPMPSVPPLEPLLVSERIRASVECIFGDTVLGFRKTFLASEIQNILDRLSFPQTSEELLGQRAAIYDSIGNLQFFSTKYRVGTTAVEWLLKVADEIFRMADEISTLTDPQFDIDSALIRDLTFSHRECLSFQETLDTQLVGLSRRLDHLDIEEHDTIEAEERLRELRKRQQAQRCFLNEQIGHLKKSLDEQREIEAKLHQARKDVEEKQFRASEQAKAHKKLQEGKLHELIGSVVSFCCKID